MADQPKQHNTVSDMLHAVLPGLAFAADLQQQIDSRRIVRRLALWRNLKGLTQLSVNKLKAVHARGAFHIEGGIDDHVTIREIKNYATAGGVSLEELLRFLAGDGK